MYSDGREGWTTDHKKAHDYKSALSALQAASRMDGKELFLVLKFPDSKLDISHAISSYKSVPPRTSGTSSERHP